MATLEEHRGNIHKAFGPLLADHVETIWNDAIASITNKSNSFSEDDLSDLTTALLDGLDYSDLYGILFEITMEKFKSSTDEEVEIIKKVGHL